MARGRKTEPAVVGGPPNDVGDYPAPEQLGPAARAKWAAMIPELIRSRGSLTQGDQDALAQYCTAMVNYLRAAGELETAELLSTGKNGISYMNPLFNVVANLEASVVKNAARLGLDTAARARVKIKSESVKKSDAFADFAKKAPGRRTQAEAMADDAGV